MFKEQSISTGTFSPIEETVAYRMYRTSRLIRHIHYLTFQQHGFDLTPEQWFILNKLAGKSPQSQTELGENLIDDRPNMTRLLSTLEKKGWITRRPDPTNRRKTEVELTPEGHGILERGMPFALKVRDELRMGIAETDLSRLWEVLDRLDENMETIIRRHDSDKGGE